MVNITSQWRCSITGYHSHIRGITVAIEINLCLLVLQNSPHHTLIIIERRPRWQVTSQLAFQQMPHGAARFPVYLGLDRADSVSNRLTKMFHAV